MDGRLGSGRRVRLDGQWQTLALAGGQYGLAGAPTLEVTHPGFHESLSHLVAEGLSYDEILNTFGGKLGDHQPRVFNRAG